MLPRLSPATSGLGSAPSRLVQHPAQGAFRLEREHQAPARQHAYFRTLASASGSGSAVVDFTRSMLIRLLTFFGCTAAISRL